MLKDKLTLIKIDRRSSLSLSAQLYNELRSLVLDRHFIYLEKICTPIECAQTLGMNERDVNKAFDQLLKENIVIKKEDTYYVNQYDFSSNFFSKIVKVYDAIKDLGLDPSMTEVQRKIIKVDKSLSEKSKFKVDTKVLYFRRIYKGNEQPLIILDLYYDLAILPDLDKYLSDETPIYETLFHQFDHKITKSHRIIDVINLPKDIASLFNVKSQTAGFKVTAQTYNQFEQMIEYTEGYSADNYSYEFDMPIKEIIEDYKLMNQNL